MQFCRKAEWPLLYTHLRYTDIHTYIHSYIQYIRSTEETLQESIATVATSQSQQVQNVRYEVVFLF